MRMTPSRPKRAAKGSRAAAQMDKRVLPCQVRLAISQMMRPAGAAAVTARPSTKSVRSRRERIRTGPNWGRRYGGSSRVKKEGTPFNMVRDSSQEARKVAAMPKRMTPVSRRAARALEEKAPAAPVKNRVMRVRITGKRPLHGTKLLVRMAMRRSLGESMMRQPVTPAALQPKPMQRVSPCFPQEWQHWKAWSRL